MLKLVGLILFVAAPGFAHAENFSCTAPVNLDHGYSFAFSINIAPLAVGSDILVRGNGTEYLVGQVNDVMTLDAGVAADKSVFEILIDMISAEDVSGLTAEKIAKVTAIQLIRSFSKEGDETMIIRAFKGDTPIGGTLWHGGEGTACL